VVDGGCDDRPVKPGICEETDIVDPGDSSPVEEAAGIARPHLFEVFSTRPRSVPTAPMFRMMHPSNENPDARASISAGRMPQGSTRPPLMSMLR